jgi:hypothetical protein
MKLINIHPTIEPLTVNTNALHISTLEPTLLLFH